MTLDAARANAFGGSGDKYFERMLLVTAQNPRQVLQAEGGKRNTMLFRSSDLRLFYGFELEAKVSASNSANHTCGISGQVKRIHNSPLRASRVALVAWAAGPACDASQA